MVLKPAREHATNNAQTYFITSDTWERRALFNVESWARLFFKTLLLHRGESYLLHEFVLMPDHFHLLITPVIALERAVQLIKGGFSYQAKKELGSNMEIWRRGFADHRIRDAEDYDKHLHYIHLNPVKKHLCASPAKYRYSSAYPGWKLDPVPQGLKPEDFIRILSGTAKAVPFQSNDKQGLKPQVILGAACGTAEAVPFQSNSTDMIQEIEKAHATQR
jgi:putative transposase